MKLLQMADNILTKIDELELEGKRLDKLAIEKATALTRYECSVAKTLIQLKNGVSMVIDGDTISNPPVSIMDKIVKGACYKSKLEADVAESNYKNCITKIDILKAQLCGYQSINKHLSEA